MFWGYCRFAAAAFVVVFAFCPVAHGQSGYPPVEAFGQLPEIREPLLSPDGKHFAAIQSVQGRPAAVIYTVGGSTPPVVITSREDIVYQIAWAKNDRLLVSLKLNTAIHWSDNPTLVRTLSRTFSASVDGKEQIMLLDNTAMKNNGAASIDDLDVEDRDHVFMSIYNGLVTDQFLLTLYRVDLRTGDDGVVVVGNDKTIQWLMDGHGNLVGRIDQTTNPLQDHLKAYTEGSWRPIADFGADYKTSEDPGADIQGLSEDGKSFLRITLGENGKDFVQRIDMGSGATNILYANPDYDINGVIRDGWTKAMVGVIYVDDRPRLVYFDPTRQALQRGLEQTFPGVNASAYSSDLRRDHVIVEASSPRLPTTYYYLDRTTHQASKIGSAYPKLSEADLGEMKPYPYKARDGLDIPAYITLPPGRSPKNLPAVVMPHGGPEARDAIGFDWWAQFLANRGYVVLQPNYRGSSGYGHKFIEAGLHQWGLKMQDDITDGVKKMIADGIADPKRVCIVGASYGGYAALAGATLTPDLYACAFSYAGISDLTEMIHSERETYGPYSTVASYWESRVGDPFHDEARFAATSPALHADKARCPILLMHGEGDTTVPIAQSERMENALRTAGKNVRFVRLTGEDHYLNLADTRMRMLTELESFLAANIGH